MNGLALPHELRVLKGAIRALQPVPVGERSMWSGRPRRSNSEVYFPRA